MNLNCNFGAEKIDTDYGFAKVDRWLKMLVCLHSNVQVSLQ